MIRTGQDWSGWVTRPPTWVPCLCFQQFSILGLLFLSPGLIFLRSSAFAFIFMHTKHPASFVLLTSISILLKIQLWFHHHHLVVHNHLWTLLVLGTRTSSESLRTLTGFNYLCIAVKRPPTWEFLQMFSKVIYFGYLILFFLRSFDSWMKNTPGKKQI